MKNFEIVIILFTVLIALLAIIDRMKLPNAVILVIAGFGIGFIPSLQSLTLNPDVVFLIFLPPILYDAASHASWHDFKSEIKPISTLAIALVFSTTLAVAIACYFFIPGFSWPLAFILGAIVSPPDAAAAISITKRLGLNKRIITILEGESLVNDAAALITYRSAIVAFATGSFILWEASLYFFISGIGGVLSGLVIGFILINIHKHILNNSIISTSLTFLTPFISYLIAERLHTSGVLAVVSTGLIISWRASEIFSYQTRIRNRAVWDTVIFLLNGFIFILIGLQFPLILADLSEYSIGELILYGLLVTGVIFVVRLIWVLGAVSAPFVKDASISDNNVNWKNILIIAWTGTRGVVSLATALALPLSLIDGRAFPLRSLILFLAMIVIFSTLVIQGLTLPLLLKILGIKPLLGYPEEERNLRLLVANKVLSFIEHDFPDDINTPLKTQVKNRYVQIIEELSDGTVKNEPELPGKNRTSEVTYLSEQAKINAFQRQLLTHFHKEGTFNEYTLRRLEDELDQQDLELNRLSKKDKKKPE
ncbi:MAG TPA: Na+/H+ antiporter [Cytophagaceae bacterium]|nr:Na+/H+ antiporter [Cytophagaceae bacterium]